VIEVPRDVEVEPAPLEERRLEARRVWHGNDERAIGREDRAHAFERGLRIREVLERVPHRDGIERTAAPDLVDRAVDIEACLACVLGRAADIGPDAFPAGRDRCAEEVAVTTADVQEGALRAGRGREQPDAPGEAVAVGEAVSLAVVRLAVIRAEVLRDRGRVTEAA
jgi:hypothetical protein